MILLSTALFTARYRSFLFWALSSGLIVLAAMLLAPKADALSPKMFQLWLMSPEVLTGLSLAQILISSIAIFGSLRQEFCPERSGRLMHEIRSWLVVSVAVLPSPVLVVFLFRVEQNMMIATRQTAPALLGLRIALVLVAILALASLILCFWKRYRLFTLHFFTGVFLVLSGALLPCLTAKLSFSTMEKAVDPVTAIPLFALALAVVAVGVFRKSRRIELGK